MPKRIAVSEMLQPVKKMLSQEGYAVVNLEHNANISPHEMDDYQAVIISGVDQNMMGIENIHSRAVVINAEGMTPVQVLEELRGRLG